MACQSVPDDSKRPTTRQQRTKVDRVRHRKVNRALVIIKARHKKANNKTTKAG